MQEINKASESRIDKLRAMLEQQPNDCFLLHALGLEHLKMGETELAIVDFERVLEIDQNYVGTYYHLALALAHLGRDSKAVFDRGITVAQSQNDRHAESELRMAYDEVFDEEWEPS